MNPIFEKLIKEMKKESSVDEQIALKKFAPLIKEIAASAAWLEEKHLQMPNPQSGFRDHLLYEGENHEMALILTSWLPGGGYSPHNHGTWAVAASIVGEQVHTLWQAKNSTTVSPIKTITCAPGDVIELPFEAIHSVANNTESLAISLQMYGLHPEYSQRQHFKEIA